MASNAVAPIESAGVPELAETPATQITFEDITPPTLYVAQRTSSAVDTGLVAYGDLFVAQGADDPEPEVLRKYEGESTDNGVLFIPLHMYKTWTWTDGSNLRNWPYGDGTVPAEAAALERDTGKPVFRTYNYVVLLPDYDTEVPVNFRLNSRSQRPAANKINMTVSKSGQPFHTSAFRITTSKKEAGGNKWAVPVVVEAKATKAQHEQAARVFEQITPGLINRARRDAEAAQATANAPTI